MFSLCIPTFNRVSETLDSFSLVINNPKIDEILIHDDGSKIEIYNKLEQKLSELNSPKIKLIRGEKNVGAFQNKILAVSKAKNEYVILLDSDNRIDDKYVEIASSQNLKPEYILFPERTRVANLDYRLYSGLNFDKQKYKELIRENTFMVLLNTGNYVFNKNSYVKAYELEYDKKFPYAVDVFYMNYLFMKNIPDAKFFVVSGLEYDHRLSSDGYWVNNSNISNMFLDYVCKKVQEL